MINGLKNMLARVMYTPAMTANIQTSKYYNPFETQNMSQDYSQQRTYAVNRPVKGGYFAGYYNGKPNIVGQRLYIDA